MITDDRGDYHKLGESSVRFRNLEDSSFSQGRMYQPSANEMPGWDNEQLRMQLLAIDRLQRLRCQIFRLRFLATILLALLFGVDEQLGTVRFARVGDDVHPL